MATYDMCVDKETLNAIDSKLVKIDYDLVEGVTQMQAALLQSGNFLAGHQFEKAKTITNSCMEISKKTSDNIRFARKYMSTLTELLQEYEKCAYDSTEV